MLAGPSLYVLLFMTGIVSGWINVLAGGGSVLSVPLMVLAGIPGPVANGTNRIGIIAQNIAAVWGFFRNGLSDFRLSMSLSLAACAGALAGAGTGVFIDGVWFDRLLVFVMIAVMIFMFTGAGQKPVKVARRAPVNIVYGHILIGITGFWGGLIHIGVGFLMMPVLNRVMGLDLVRVNMHKVFIALMFSLVSLAVFAAFVQIAWGPGLALAAGFALGGWLGAHSAVKKGESLIRKVFYAALCVMIVKLLFF